MKKTWIIVILVIILILVIVACVLLANKKEAVPELVVDTSGEEIISSGDVYIPIVDKTFGNGTSFVSYKGNIYYIEFLNDDSEDYTYTYDFSKEHYSSNSQRYVNMIKPNGNVVNLFNVSGVVSFSIFEDRFYFVKSNGTIHSTDMNGEDDKELGRGAFVSFDEQNHRVYYVLNNMKDRLWYIDTKTLEIGFESYSNSYGSDEDFVYLGNYNNCLYYYKIDSSYDNIMFVKHDLKENKDINISTEKINKTRDEKNYATEIRRYTSKLNDTDDIYKYISVGYLDGSGLFYSYGKLFEFSLRDEESSLITDSLENEKVYVIDNKLYYSNGGMEDYDVVALDLETREKTSIEANTILGSNALIKFDGVYAFISTPLSSEMLKIAKKYGFFESSFAMLESGELVDKYPYVTGYSDYDIFVNDIRVIGNNIFYTINIAKMDPTGENPYRGTIVPTFIRRAQEIYLYNLDSGKNSLVYAVSNKNFVKEIQEMEDRIESGVNNKDIEEEKTSGESSSSSSQSSALKSDEMFIEIDTSSIWKDEFDIKIEEVGGTIFGKRIEYEGHHLKSEGKLKVKIKKEKGARLIVYIDNDIFSDTVMD